MSSEHRIVDVFQIVGFAVSIAISLGLILMNQDTIASVALGLILATLTQLFDLQLRHSAAEERLLKANALSQALYRDEWLLDHVQQIVRDYLAVKAGWFELFRWRADNTITECRDVLHSMSEGHLLVKPRTPFGIGGAFAAVEESVKHAVAMVDNVYWRSTHAEAALQSTVAPLIRREVAFIRVFIQTPENVRQIQETLRRQQSAGVDVYVVSPDSLPGEEWHDDFIIVDDRVVAQTQLTVDGAYSGQRISIDPVEVEQAFRRFDTILSRASRLETIIDSLEQ